ncbi:MAG: phosphoglycerate kinase [Parcubacteria group bacterium Gr01-1014_66]|nr:MAG: phosphoglycerate kinase [Parcubacteria group bacterium Gr01-1014_66]
MNMGISPLVSLPPEHLKERKVVVRIDADVSTQDSFKDAFRLEANLKTLRMINAQGGILRMLAHWGRPGGVRDANLSLRAFLPYFSRTLGRTIHFVDDLYDEDVYIRLRISREAVLLENLRFWKGEENNDIAFAEKLARWGDLYVNEAFANAHRAHASMVALAGMLPAYAGLRLSKEVNMLSTLLEKPARPFFVVLGGAKLETKLPLIKRLLPRADGILLGGALANTVLRLSGIEMGKSHLDTTGIDQNFFLDASVREKLYLPLDVVVAQGRLDAPEQLRTRAVHEISKDEFAADIGEKTISVFQKLLGAARTIVWNGPLGYTEFIAFAKGTRAIAETLAESSATTIVGGGDIIAALAPLDVLNQFTHVSTGGGAMLAFLSGEELPALTALQSGSKS